MGTLEIHMLRRSETSGFREKSSEGRKTRGEKKTKLKNSDEPEETRKIRLSKPIYI